MRPSLAALRIERRRLSVAIFIDHHLEHAESHHLPSDYPKALRSASQFVHKVRRTFRAEYAALDKYPSDHPTQRSTLIQELVMQLRRADVAVYEVEIADLLAAFGNPPLRYRTQVRQAVASIWPILASGDNHPSCLDAAALGLYVQVEKLLASKELT